MKKLYTMINLIIFMITVTSISSASIEWTEMDSGTTNLLRDVWGSSATDVFAVGWGGTILHYDGNGITTCSIKKNSSQNRANG